MSAVLERLQEQLSGLQAEIDAEVAQQVQASVAAIQAEHTRRLEQVQQNCAEAMEAAYGDAARSLDRMRPGLIAEGKQQERERTLLLIQLVGEQLRQDGSNAQALTTLRRMVEGDEIDG